ncbi:MAG: hypothetical protein ACPG5O_04120 [Pseudoalteromonas tetraodonis]
MKNQAPTVEILKSWAKNTDAIIKDELKRQGIGVTDSLVQSLRYQVLSEGGGLYRLTFADHGRFRDMNTGRPRGESLEGNKKLYKDRKKKRWYSKTVYKRIYGSLIAQIVSGYRETITRNIKGELKGKLI